METNLYSCIRTGRTISEKTMEDGNLTGIRDEKIAATSLANLYGERPPKLTANGHDFGGESSSPGRPPANAVLDDKNRKRINPLRIHLGKRPFVDNSIQYYNPNKKRKLYVNKHSDSSAPTNTPRVPKLIPKRIHYQNIASHVENNVIDHEQNKPVPRLVPKSQLSHYKKGKVEKEPQLKEYAESLGLQPMVKFKCRKCCSMSFKTLAMLKEHQKICRAQAKEPAHSPEAPPNVAGSDANTSGPNRVTRKVYLCSACGTYYENWNLFLHMREIHNRHICLFCLGMFSKAEKLSSHLTNKHNVKEFNYESKEDFFNVYNGTLYLMCCVCDEICSEQDDFFNHDCNNIKPKPVPVLVSKNAAKSNIVKSSSNSSELSVNGPPSVVKDYSKSVSDKKDIKEGKLEMLPSQILKPVMETKTPDIISSTSMNTDTSAALLKEVNNAEDSGMELEGSDRPASSPVNWHSYSADKNNIKNTFSNGDENADHTDDSDSHISDGNESPLRDPLPAKPIDKPCLPIEKEKETGGIKLKLSLNNANSPVIINSTVDPTIGQIHHKPTRSRRPPKRYEKVPQLPVPEPVLQPKTPSIKMTICDRADSPFVKTTIYEDNKVETTIKSILNNNSESQTPEHKPESAIKTTIYDNKPEDDDNTLNRVPKLTVRVPKELLDKDSSSDYSSDSDMSEKLTVDENNVTIEENREPKEEVETECAPTETFNQLVEEDVKDEPEPDVENVSVIDEQMDFKTEVKTEPPETEIKPEPVVEEPSLPVTELALNRPLDKYPMKELLRVFLASTVYSCIYCNHVRKIAVNCEQLSLHMVAQHRFSATVDSITAEELMPETITAKLQVGAQELASVYMNLDSYDSEEKNENISYEHIFECFQCFFKTAIHKDLCLHNRKMHQKTILLCVMCKTNFLSYSELLCHVCPGTYDSEYEMKFRCCLCNVDQIPSQFRLMVHLRKIHHTCDVCLEFCHNQARLSNHVWKHKLHHMCYRCGIAYRNKLDINNHLFWKHGTESVLCKKCMQKKWPHVYHFCSPPAVFACDECNLQFTKAVCLKVHKRIHSEEFPHQCTEEGCTEKFVSKKLLNKHVNEHRKKLLIEELNEAKPSIEPAPDATKESIPTIDLVDENPSVEAGTSIVKDEPGSEQQCKKNKKKKLKDKDALLLDVNLPALNLSESDSSDESDSEVPPPPLSPPTTTITTKEEIPEDKPKIDTDEQPAKSETPVTSAADVVLPVNDDEAPPVKAEHKLEPVEEEKPNEQQVLDIWDNFKKYQAKVEKQKTPPLVPIKKHVCESDHDYCLIPTDMNGDNDVYGLDRKKNKKSPRRRRGGGGGGGLSSSSSSSSDSDSSCSCGSNCSCSSSSGSSSSSSSDSDSSDESGNEKKKPKRIKRTLPDRRISTGSNVDVMGMSETPVLVPPQVTEPPIAESDLETEESDTDEEFYDENPQSFANKLHEEKLNQLMQGPPAEPPDAPDGGVAEPEAADLPVTPVKEEEPIKEEPKPEPESLDKPASAKKKSKKKKKSKSSKKHGPIKINIPKDVIGKSESEAPPALVPNKITISLHSNTVQLPETPKAPPAVANSGSSASTLSERKRASKRRRVPNKFYGYSSDEEGPPQTPTTMAALKPQQPPKLEWRKEDLPSPMPHKAKKEVPAAPSTPLSSKLSLSLSAVRLTAPVPDPEPPRLLMNSELESNESDSSSESGAQPAPPFPPPTYLTTGTSSLPYAFQRPAARAAREGESVYCYCRCPYDEVSEMIACDAEGCPIEWFHFECVGIMVPPKGKWYCPECRKNQIFSGYR